MFGYFVNVVRDYVLAFIVFLVCRFGRCSVRNIVADVWILCRGYGFIILVSYRFPLSFLR